MSVTNDDFSVTLNSAKHLSIYLSIYLFIYLLIYLLSIHLWKFYLSIYGSDEIYPAKNAICEEDDDELDIILFAQPGHAEDKLVSLNSLQKVFLVQISRLIVRISNILNHNSCLSDGRMVDLSVCKLAHLSFIRSVFFFMSMYNMYIYVNRQIESIDLKQAFSDCVKQVSFAVQGFQ